MLTVVDLVQHAPVPPEPCTVDPSELANQGLTHPLWILEQRAGDELNGRCGDLVRQSICEGPASWG